MKPQSTETSAWPEVESRPLVLKEAPGTVELQVVSVRDAKSHLSALLDWVSGGREITITSDGKPKARLVPAMAEPARKVFRGMGDFLRNQAIDQGRSGEQIIRDDRDGREW